MLRTHRLPWAKSNSHLLLGGSKGGGIPKTQGLRSRSKGWSQNGTCRDTGCDRMRERGTIWFPPSSCHPVSQQWLPRAKDSPKAASWSRAWEMLPAWVTPSAMEGQEMDLSQQDTGYIKPPWEVWLIYTPTSKCWGVLPTFCFQTWGYHSSDRWKVGTSIQS